MFLNNRFILGTQNSKKVALKLFFIVFFLTFFSCKSVKKDTLFQLMENTGIVFNNQVNDTQDENSFRFRNFYNGGGVAIGDINNDGLPDVILTSNLGANKIFLNQGNFKFTDFTATSGLVQNGQWSTGVSFVDINNDGWLDIYVCNSGHVGSNNRKNQLYINNHNNTFTECAAKYGLDHSGYSTQAAFFDYDMDGDLDCIIIDNSPIPFGTLNYANMRDSAESAWKIPAQYKGGGNHLFRNDNGHYTEVTKQAGLHTSLLSFGLSISIADINGDGYPDMYVGNDFMERDYLYINQKNGTFKDELEQRLQHISMSSMGTDIADMNNDGYPDIYTTDMIPSDDYRFKTNGTFDNFDLFKSKIKAGFYNQYVRNCLQINGKNGKFQDVANYGGVAMTDWSWGVVLFDADNDGLNDIYVCNGINRDLSNLDFLDFFSNANYQKMLQSDNKQQMADSLIKKIPQNALLNKAYKNVGNYKFEDIGEAWGFKQPSFSNSVAYADLDNDGDLDMIVNNENQPAFVYKNNARETNGNHYVSLNLKGGNGNLFAIGATVKIYAGSNIFYRELEPVRGFQSAMDYKMVIGLGKDSLLDSMVVVWPNRSSSSYLKPKVDMHYSLSQTDGKKRDINIKNIAQAVFTPSPNIFDKHQEDDYEDFYYERNIPEMLSRLGPKAAVGDVDGDGLDDIYIGGAAGQAGQLYIQQKTGGFIKKREKIFDQFANFEDVSVLLFDADHDGDLDLFIGPGGNNQPTYSREMQLRLYKNDGKGNFELDANAFPNNGMNISVAAACDFDNDGDLDLFVGGRSLPHAYGSTPSSYIFVNDGHGHFTDMAATKNPEIAKIGMVTGAVWADMNGDKKNDLIITGEWMAPRIFSFTGNHFEEIKTNLGNMFGWWQTVAVADLNGDGKMDLVLGNVGENFYLQPDSLNPVKLWINDFDKNGALEKIMTKTIDGKDIPVFLKHDMEDQIPSLKKQSLLHDVYAKKCIQDLFSPDIIKNSVVNKFNYTASCIAINKGNGQFAISKLPAQVQFSSVNALKLMDVNGDGFMDIITGGNLFGFLPQFGRLDASIGNVLINNGKGQFNCLDALQSGLDVTGETRDIETFKSVGKNYLLFLRNDDYPKLYELALGQKAGNPSAFK